jgi:hypothetical protein
MTLTLALLALTGSAFFLWLGRRPPALRGRPTRLRLLGARTLQGLYLVSGALLLARGVIGLASLSS